MTSPGSTEAPSGSPQATTRVVAVVSDLFFVARIREVARFVGVPLVFARSADEIDATLAAGARLVLLDLTRPDFVPLNDALLQLVFSEAGAAVDTVMIDGRVVLDRGRLVTVDEEKVRRAAEAAAARLREANAGLAAAARALEPFVGAFCLGLTREPYPIARVLPPDPA